MRWAPSLWLKPSRDRQLFPSLNSSDRKDSTMLCGHKSTLEFCLPWPWRISWIALEDESHGFLPSQKPSSLFSSSLNSLASFQKRTAWLLPVSCPVGQRWSPLTPGTQAVLFVEEMWAFTPSCLCTRGAHAQSSRWGWTLRACAHPPSLHPHVPWEAGQCLHPLWGLSKSETWRDDWG